MTALIFIYINEKENIETRYFTSLHGRVGDPRLTAWHLCKLLSLWRWPLQFSSCSQRHRQDSSVQFSSEESYLLFEGCYKFFVCY